MLIHPFESRLYEWVIGASTAVVALWFTANSFIRLRKTEQIRLAESILRDVRNSINEYNIITSKPPLVAEQVDKFNKKLNRFLDNNFEALNWYCNLIEIGEIKDKHLLDYSKRILIKWHDDFFVKDLGVEILSGDKYLSFKKVYQKFKKEEEDKLKSGESRSAGK